MTIVVIYRTFKVGKETNFPKDKATLFSQECFLKRENDEKFLYTRSKVQNLEL